VTVFFGPQCSYTCNVKDFNILYYFTQTTPQNTH